MKCREQIVWCTIYLHARLVCGTPACWRLAVCVFGVCVCERARARMRSNAFSHSTLHTHKHLRETDSSTAPRLPVQVAVLSLSQIEKHRSPRIVQSCHRVAAAAISLSYVLLVADWVAFRVPLGAIRCHLRAFRIARSGQNNNGGTQRYQDRLRQLPCVDL